MLCVSAFGSPTGGNAMNTMKAEESVPVTRLADLPAPPEGKTGWPWTEEAAPATVSWSHAGGDWPRISIVTPSLNQGEFIEQTIRSVLLQGYPNLEYIIIDGGSTDDTVSVIEKYARHISYWVSRRDRGQSHAVNEGFQKSTGEVMCWLNSDDFYMPETLRVVAETLVRESGNVALVGHAVRFHADGRPPARLEGRYEGPGRLLRFWEGYAMHQPSVFWRREVFEKVGYLDEAQHLILDFDYWVRIARHFDFVNVDRTLSGTNYHAKAKTGDDYRKYHEELRRQSPRYWGSPLSSDYWRLKASMLEHFYLRRYVRSVRLAAQSLARLPRRLGKV